MKEILMRTWTGVSIGVAVLVIVGYLAPPFSTDKLTAATCEANLSPLFAVGKRLECQVSDHRALEYEILKIDKDSNWVEANRIIKQVQYADGQLSGPTRSEVLWINLGHFIWCKEIKPSASK